MKMLREREREKMMVLFLFALNETSTCSVYKERMMYVGPFLYR